VILIDTSAWIEYLRATGSPVNLRVRALLGEESEFVTCHPVRMEMLMGARDEDHLRKLSRLLARGRLLATHVGHYDEAASLYRACRRQGATIRKAMDCLIAAHAIRAAIPVLHHDSDFTVLARHTAMREETAAAQ
jgi:predicted nucleic acid-binding protein